MDSRLRGRDTNRWLRAWDLFRVSLMGSRGKPCDCPSHALGNHKGCPYKRAMHIKQVFVPGS